MMVVFSPFVIKIRRDAHASAAVASSTVLGLAATVGSRGS
jgi:hypothetical protein